MAAWRDPRRPHGHERNWPWILILVIECVLMLVLVHYR